MKIFIAGVSGDTQYVKGVRSFFEIIPRPGDKKQEKVSGRGDISRMVLGEMFFEEKEFEALAMFDLDMRHPADILEKLRTDMERDNLDMVTGHYYSRNSAYIHSVCWHLGNGRWPFVPMIDPPRSGLHQIGMTGMGCVLIKREVYEAVQNYLPSGDKPFAIGTDPNITADSRTLGTDFRFFSIAQMLGYKLWLDADIESLHATLFWIGRDEAEKLYDPSMVFEYLHALSDQIRKADGMDKKFLETRRDAIEAHLKKLNEQHTQFQESADKVFSEIKSVQGALLEDKFLLQQLEADAEAFPVVPEEDRQKMLDNRTTLEGVSEKDARIARETVYQKEAKGWIDDIAITKNADFVS